MIPPHITPAWLEREASRIEAEATALPDQADMEHVERLRQDAAGLRFQAWRLRQAMRRRGLLRVVGQ